MGEVTLFYGSETNMVDLLNFLQSIINKYQLNLSDKKYEDHFNEMKIDPPKNNIINQGICKEIYDAYIISFGNTISYLEGIKIIGIDDSYHNSKFSYLVGLETNNRLEVEENVSASMMKISFSSNEKIEYINMIVKKYFQKPNYYLIYQNYNM